MTSNKPYFLRALYEWILDNNCTPYIVVDATLPFVEVPEQFVSEGRIILNILPSAIHNLIIDDEWISFSARFSGVSEVINIPMGAVAAIFAHENSEGMGFDTEALPEDYFAETTLKVASKTSKKSSSKKPALGIVENLEETDPETDLSADTKAIKTEEDNVKASKKTTDRKKKPTLTIIK